MFKIENNQIFLTRGDKAILDFSIEGYVFQVGDVLKFKVYDKRKLNESPKLLKPMIVKEKTDTVTFVLNSEDTKIGEMLNSEREYWYEVELNNDTTIIGFDDDGAKILTLYPEGADSL